MSRLSNQLAQSKQQSKDFEMDMAIRNKKINALVKVASYFGSDMLSDDQLKKQEQMDKIYFDTAKNQTIGVFTKQAENGGIRVSINCIDFLKFNNVSKTGNIHFVLKNENGYWVARPFKED